MEEDGKQAEVSREGNDRNSSVREGSHVGGKMSEQVDAEIEDWESWPISSWGRLEEYWPDCYPLR